MPDIVGSKVIVSRWEVSRFNSRWPCSELDDNRSYWFDFDSNGDLVDVDVPEHSDGSAASAMADDCRDFIMNGERAVWMTE